MKTRLSGYQWLVFAACAALTLGLAGCDFGGDDGCGDKRGDHNGPKFRSNGHDTDGGEGHEKHHGEGFKKAKAHGHKKQCSFKHHGKKKPHKKTCKKERCKKKKQHKKSCKCGKKRSDHDCQKTKRPFDEEDHEDTDPNLDPAFIDRADSVR